MSSAARYLAAGLVLASRVFFLPPTLEDIDSVNFALALGDFNPALHQPHPPGSPVYVAAAKLLNQVVPEPARALPLLSALSQAALLPALLALFEGLSLGTPQAWAAALLVLANPIVWFNGARPMSDSFGLLFVVAAQALLLRRPASPRALVAGSLLAALAAGVRLQSTLLTLPLWLAAVLRAREKRGLAAAALALGLLAWAGPLVIESGGISAYRAAFTRALQDSLPVEPLLTGFTLNRGMRAALWVAVRPWASPALGVVMSLLALLGLSVALRQRRPALGLALLAFGPYLLAHALMQQVQTVRYSLPYIPFVAWLAVQAVEMGAARTSSRRRDVVTWVAATAIAGWSAVVTLPALAAYHRTVSPPYAALRTLEKAASPREAFVLGGHYMFFRYLGSRPAGLEVIEPRPRREMAGLQAYWLQGGSRTVLFLAEPERTDLESIDPAARRTLGRWGWSLPAHRFLPGERPNRLDLVAITRPEWFAGEGWLLSLEAGRVSELRRFQERRAYLASRSEPTFLLVAGEPTEAAAGDFEIDLALAGERLDRRPGGVPLLQGYLLDEPAAASPYLELLASARRQGHPAGAPFALRGLAYGARSAPGLVHGDGWFYPETDEASQPFRWASRRARSLLHVPRDGARLVIEGVAPIEYVGRGVHAQVQIDGRERASALLHDRRFRFDVDVPAGEDPFREAVLSADRSFVPDRIQRNGDRRDLALRIYRYDLESSVVER